MSVELSLVHSVSASNRMTGKRAMNLRPSSLNQFSFCANMFMRKRYVEFAKYIDTLADICSAYSGFSALAELRYGQTPATGHRLFADLRALLSDGGHRLFRRLSGPVAGYRFQARDISRSDRRQDHDRRSGPDADIHARYQRMAYRSPRLSSCCGKSPCRGSGSFLPACRSAFPCPNWPSGKPDFR